MTRLGREAARSIVIGQGTMPVACARLLVRRGHEVMVTSSPDAPLREWSSSAGVPHVQRISELLTFLEHREFDYLFSVVNYRVLPHAVLVMPRLGAINYHDSPLPRYAGTYATSWAIMHGETEHGITWHQMTDELDAGDVVAQVAVPIAPNETAGSLNHKCFFTGVHALGRLVADLAAGTLQPARQEMKRRTYQPFLLRPPGACTIDFARETEEVARFVRALSFGQSPNPFGTPKIAVGDTWLIVATATPLATGPSALPGTVIEAHQDTMVVATGNGRVLLEGLRSMSGQLVDAAPFAWSRAQSPLSGSRMTLATAAYERAMRDERRWVRGLETLKPVIIARHGSTNVCEPPRLTASRSRASQFVTVPVERHATATAVAHARFLMRTGLAADASVGVLTEERLASTRSLGDLLCPSVPVRLDALVEWRETRVTGVLEMESHGLAPYLTDLHLRYAGQLSEETVQPPVVIGLVDNAAIERVPASARGSELTVLIARNGSDCRWYSTAPVAEHVAALGEDYVEWFQPEKSRR